MLTRIIGWAVRNRVLVLLATAGGDRRRDLGGATTRRSRRCPI